MTRAAFGLVTDDRALYRLVDAERFKIHPSSADRIAHLVGITHGDVMAAKNVALTEAFAQRLAGALGLTIEQAFRVETTRDPGPAGELFAGRPT